MSNNENYEKVLEQIDSQIQIATSRKVWIQKCELEREVEDLSNEVAILKEANKTLKAAVDSKSLFKPGLELYEIEKAYIIAAVEFYKDKISAARALGITVKSLYNKLHDFNYKVHRENA